MSKVATLDDVLARRDLSLILRWNRENMADDSTVQDIFTAATDRYLIASDRRHEKGLTAVEASDPEIDAVRIAMAEHFDPEEPWRPEMMSLDDVGEAIWKITGLTEALLPNGYAPEVRIHAEGIPGFWAFGMENWIPEENAHSTDLPEFAKAARYWPTQAVTQMVYDVQTRGWQPPTHTLAHAVFYASMQEANTQDFYLKGAKYLEGVTEEREPSNGRIVRPQPNFARLLRANGTDEAAHSGYYGEVAKNLLHHRPDFYLPIAMQTLEKFEMPLGAILSPQEIVRDLIRLRRAHILEGTGNYTKDVGKRIIDSMWQTRTTQPKTDKGRKAKLWLLNHAGIPPDEIESAMTDYR